MTTDALPSDGSVQSTHKRKEPEKTRDFVESFARGLRVIESFAYERRGLSTARVSQKTGLSRAATRRFLFTLEMLNYADNVDGVFYLKPSILRLGSSYLSSTNLPAIAQPVLEEISEIIHESTSLSVLDEDDIVYLARHTSATVLSASLSVGSRLPAYCTAMGRVLLADLPSARLNQYLARVKIRRWTAKTVHSRAELADLLRGVAEQGYCLVDGELEAGLRSIAVPIRTANGRTVAAINAGAHISTVSAAEMVKRVLPVLRTHADLLSGLL